ncbi:MAG: hypothetical protein ACKESB_02490 [Candidatus Hodgkinia cicadicola]
MLSRSLSLLSRLSSRIMMEVWSFGTGGGFVKIESLMGWGCGDNFFRKLKMALAAHLTSCL